MVRRDVPRRIERGGRIALGLAEDVEAGTMVCQLAVPEGEARPDGLWDEQVLVAIPAGSPGNVPARLRSIPRA
jgi:hypothetical protein